MPTARGVGDAQIETLAADRADDALDIGVLPRRSRRGDDLLDSHRLDTISEGRPISRIAVSQQKARRGVPGESLGDLAGQPGHAPIKREAVLVSAWSIISDARAELRRPKRAGWMDQPSDNLLIGLRPGQVHYEAMIRLRFLAGLLGCLSILASGMPAVVLALAPMLNATPAQTTASEPCAHCPDCDAAPCQQAVAGCVLACVAAPLTIGVAEFALPVIDTVAMIWPRRSAAISGQSPPPDPFPPRT